MKNRPSTTLKVEKTSNKNLRVETEAAADGEERLSESESDAAIVSSESESEYTLKEKLENISESGSEGECASNRNLRVEAEAVAESGLNFDILFG